MTAPSRSHSPTLAWATGVSLIGTMAWAYWPTICRLVSCWSEDPDYGHGFLVVPFAVYLVWQKRGSFPWQAVQPSWSGLILLAFGLLLRYMGAMYRAFPVDGWSMVVWIMGVVLLVGGTRLGKWCLVPMLFLLFMIPLPYRVERWLNEPLQACTAEIACFLLRLLGHPAWSEGSLMFLGEEQFVVSRTCAGLRIFFGVLALGFAISALRQRWIERFAILLAVGPVALLTNALRVFAAALSIPLFSDESARHLMHDVCGWTAIPVAILLFVLSLAWINRLFEEAPEITVGELLCRRWRSSTLLNELEAQN